MPDDPTPKTDTPVNAPAPQPVTPPQVKEHPISETEAQKYAGQGDFSLPVSPLDELLGELSKDQPASSPPPAAQPIPSQNPVVEMAPPLNPKQLEPKPVQPPPEKPKTEVKPVQPPPPKQAEPAPPAGKSVDLEKKAKDMLKQMNKPVETGKVKSSTAVLTPAIATVPKVKKPSSLATKMAFAAVFLVLVGSATVAGLNIVKLNQTTENRSRAGGTTPGFCCNSNYGECKNGLKTCTGPGGCTASVVCDNSIRCLCCDNNWHVGAPSDRQCSTLCSGVSCNRDEVKKCACTNWSDGCGHDCNFPDDTQSKLDAEAAANCGKKYVAMCDISTGATSILQVDPSNKCMTDAALAACKNPTAKKNCDTPQRQNMCLSTQMSKTSLKPGETLTVRGTSKLDAKSFLLAFYNPDNLANPSDPNSAKRYAVNGSDYGMTANASPTAREYTFTVKYEDIQRPDSNWGNKVPTKISFMFYFTDTNGQLSLPEAPCWGQISFTAAAAPTIRCNNLTKDAVSPAIGSTVTFTCDAAVTGSTSTAPAYEFQYQAPGATTYTKVSGNSGKTWSLTIDKAGTYSVQCRACSTLCNGGICAQALTCTDWGSSAVKP